MQQEVRDLTAVVQRLAYEVQRNKENGQHEREKLILRLENALIRSERLRSPLEAQEERGKDAEIAALLLENEELRKRLEQHRQE